MLGKAKAIWFVCKELAHELAPEKCYATSFGGIARTVGIAPDSKAAKTWLAKLLIIYLFLIPLKFSFSKN